MKRTSIILSIYFLLFIPIEIDSKELIIKTLIDFNSLPLNDSQKKHLLNDRHLIFSNMEEIEFKNLDGPFKKMTQSHIDGEKKSNDYRFQSWNFSITGLHPRPCLYALRWLSRYEQYENFISFIEKSSYDNENERLEFLLQSQLLPFSMILSFTLPRINDTGVYSYHFDQGFLKGLQGEIHVSQHHERCLFHSTANWQGVHTGIPSVIFEGFSHALSDLAMRTLFRISRN